MYLLIGIIYFGMSHECHQLLSLVVWSETSFTFLCSKDILNITDEMGIMFGFYCGNMTGKNLLVTGDQVIISFKSDDNVEQRGYRLVFTLVSPQGKWDHKEAD